MSPLILLGIGKVTVRELARSGATVILASRSLEKGETAKKEICQETDGKCDIRVMALDLSSFASVRSFAKEFKSKFLKLNYLFLNAGVMACPFALSADGYEMQFATNHLGHFFLVEELFRLLLESDCRVTVVSSIAHTRPYSGGINFNQLNNSDNYNPM
jgi:NAD(P)-dependent dehydrogenase (short-subunit alcohol dehydrogenase family)